MGVGTTMMHLERTLDAITTQAGWIDGIRKTEVGLGDRLIVETRNSHYLLVSLGDGRFQVSGGWFDRQGASPATTTINGCTWGGTAIRTDLAARHGLFLEFGNTVRTTRIQKVRLLRSTPSPSIH
jgi:hypothetical protein